MRLTTKARYAVTAMLDIALYGNGGLVTAADISKRQAISQSYLEHLFSKLRHGRLVKSVHGPGGGYFLAKSLSEISIADIIQAVNEPIDATQCRGKLNCQAGRRCMTHALWAELNEEINRYLTSVSLSHLVAQQMQMVQHGQPMRGEGIDQVHSVGKLGQ
jgi:Rrf2 family transcriptional regulator, iron-sulfur cluster assembly transcription factor